MKVTDVRIRRFNSEGKMRAIVSVTLNDQFVVHDVRVIEGNNGFLWPCPASGPPAVSLRISLTRLIPLPGRRSRRLYWKFIFQNWKSWNEK